jgi:hypothetical protein
MLFLDPWLLSTTHVQSLTAPYTLSFHRFSSDLIMDPERLLHAGAKQRGVATTSDIETVTGCGVLLHSRRCGVGSFIISYLSCSTYLPQLSYSNTFTVLRHGEMLDP